jgi:hypothetical protein
MDREVYGQGSNRPLPWPPILAPPILAPRILAPPILAPQILAPRILAPPILAPPILAPPVTPALLCQLALSRLLVTALEGLATGLHPVRTWLPFVAPAAFCQGVAGCIGDSDPWPKSRWSAICQQNRPAGHSGGLS